ncbi:enterobactin exporter EntS [Raoultella terrigena]|uniref:Enterobactin exporter EntS n=1 Tax=Raoultella terrigena TaxID=577 RepID=A0A485B9J5_RAOTE|nr:enterobactin exporter EntS [Raoultella terrigena]
MNRQSRLLNLSLLKTHPAFRAVFIARFISILSLGLLGVAIPVQIQMMTHSTLQVGLSVTLTGGSMFIGLMVGGVLADRYERKRLILLARGTCGIGFVGLCLNAMLPEPSLAAIYLLGVWDGFFASLGVTALLAATPRAGWPGKSDAGRGDYHADGAPGLGDFADDRRPAAGDRRRSLELRPGGGRNLYHHFNPAAFTAAPAGRLSRASIR